MKWAIVIIAAGILLRAWLAVSAMPMVYPDEQFQTLEPASRVVFGFGWKSWEWEAGVRSWVVPGLFMPVLFALKLVGIHGGPASVHLCRLWVALWSGAALWGFHRLLADRGIGAGAHLAALALLCLCPAMGIWSAATFSEDWALIALWGLLPITARALERGEPAQWLLSGVLLGLTFTMRVQMAAWMVGLGAVLLWSRSDRRGLLPLGLGYLLPVLCQGLLDLVTWGRLFHSARENFAANLLRGVADLNGRLPWHAYFRLVWKDLGPWVLIPLLASLGLALLLRRLRFRHMDRFILVPALGFVVAHSIIGHKETRFLLPAYPALFYLFALALDGLTERLPGEGLRVKACAASVLIAPWSAHVAANPARFPSLDSSELCVAIRRDGRLRIRPQGVLLLVENSWVWTRGELLFSGPVHYREVSADALTEADAEECAYAIIPGWFEAEFRARTRAVAAWTRVKRDAHGNALMRRREEPHQRFHAALPPQP
jgi:hypothetical protein